MCLTSGNDIKLLAFSHLKLKYFHHQSVSDMLENGYDNSNDPTSLEFEDNKEKPKAFRLEDAIYLQF
jgi:hypothetical protein